MGGKYSRSRLTQSIQTSDIPTEYKNITLVGHINEIIWNSKKFYQINIKDLII